MLIRCWATLSCSSRAIRWRSWLISCRCAGLAEPAVGDLELAVALLQLPGALAGLLVEAGVLQRHRQLVGDDLQDRHVAVVDRRTGQRDAASCRPARPPA